MNIRLLIALLLCSTMAFSQGTGEVIITEIHNRPKQPTQTELNAALPNNPAGADATPNEGHTEWFEVFNTTSSAIVMDGWIIQDASSSSATSIIGSFTLPANSYAVFAGFNIPDAQGGLTFDYFYDYKKPSFNNESSYADPGDNACPDGIILQKGDGTLVDEVMYDYGYGEYIGNANSGSCSMNSSSIGFPAQGGSSKISMMLNFDPAIMNAADNDLAANWSFSTITYDAAGSQLGTPGLQNDGAISTGGTGQVIITEIHNRPLKPTQAQLDAALPNNPAGADLVPDEGHVEWFEVYNTTSSPVVMDGWIIEDGSNGSTSVISSFTLAPNDYAVFAGFNIPGAHGGVVFDYFFDYEMPSFNNESSYADVGDTSCPDGVILSTANGTLVDQVLYDYGYGFYIGNSSSSTSCSGNTAPIGFPDQNFGSRYSMMLNCNPGVMNSMDNDLAANWSFSTSVYDDNSAEEYSDQYGTPGAQNDNCTALVDNDMDTYLSDVDCDDNNPDVNPGQTEIPGNGLDDDCDPSTLDVAAGSCTAEVIITEIHNRPLKPTQAQLDAALPNNPAGADLVPDEGHVEWFEVYNTTSSPVVMDGWIIEDGSNGSTSVISSFTLAPNAYAVFAGFNIPDAQGGVVFDYFFDYEMPSFNNESSYADVGDTSCPDGVILSKGDGTLVDQVLYDYGYGFYIGNAMSSTSCSDNVAAIGFPGQGFGSRYSMMLNCDPAVMNCIDNDFAANWSFSTAVYDDNSAEEYSDQYGTPGLQNDAVCGALEDNDMDNYFSDVDCDDNNPDVNPGQTEIPGNGLDDDCDPSTMDVPCTAEVIITEIHNRPLKPTQAQLDAALPNNPSNPNIDLVPDEGHTEWFEVYNTTSSPVVMDGWVIQDGSNGSTSVITSFTLAPNAYAVFAGFDIPAAHGGVVFDYFYDYEVPSFNNESSYSDQATDDACPDGVRLSKPNGTLVDEVLYDYGYGFYIGNPNSSASCSGNAAAIGIPGQNSPSRTSFQLNPDPAVMNCLDNDLAENWSFSTSVYDDNSNEEEIGDQYGTPGSANTSGVPGCTNPCSANYNPDATEDDGSCEEISVGCTDATACNYDPNAICENGTCDFTACAGCTNQCSANYDPNATSDDGSCSEELIGCTNTAACNYDPTALCESNLCDFTSCQGCTNQCSANYDPNATSDDGSCSEELLGCTNTTACNYDPTALCESNLCDFTSCAGCTNECSANYDPNATIDDGSCQIISVGCTDATACNYNPNAICENGTCDFTSCAGCTNQCSANYDPNATSDDGSCSEELLGCTNATACNYDPTALCESNLCDFTSCAGCTNECSANYDPNATIDDGSCQIILVGCTDATACNYDPIAICENGTCDFTSCQGCTNQCSANYDPNATQDNGSCSEELIGCTNTTACNYDPTALCESNLCNFGNSACTDPCNPVMGCTDATACNFDAAACVDDGSCNNNDPGTGNTDPCLGDTEVWNATTCMYDVNATQVLGCTDASACNYDAAANCDDGSCNNDDPGTGNTDTCLGDTEVWNATTCMYDVDVAQVLGCTDASACNYDASANCDDGSCDSGNADCTDPCNPIVGCTDPTATNYDNTACVNEGCSYTMGCTDPTACNYDAGATIDDGSCNNDDPGTGNTDTCLGDTEVWNATTCMYDVDVAQVLGCTDASACNYDASANCDDGSCDSGNADCTDPCNPIVGCTDPTATNYDDTACVNEGCTYTMGCTDPAACNYDATATVDDGSCDLGNADCTDPCNPIVGCTDPTATNYDDTACVNEGCTYTMGCTDPAACNYDATATVDDGSCNNDDPGTGNTDPCLGDTEVWNATTCMYDVDAAQVIGCTDATACNYDAAANCDDGSCDSGNTDCTDPCNPIIGCTDPTAINYDDTACVNEGCSYATGCTDPTACNYDAGATVDDGSCNNDDPGTGNTDPCLGDTEVWNAATCMYDIDAAQVIGCTDATVCNYDPAANCDDGSCDSGNTDCTDPCNPLSGCTDATACNYDPTACVDDGSCVLPDGCTDSAATNYDSSALCDDGSCTYDMGCTDPTACNYDVNAIEDDGSCDFGNSDCADPCVPVMGCTDAAACNYDAMACVDDGSCENGVTTCPDPCSVTLGCTDATACNFDSAANCDDGSCVSTVDACTDPAACNYNSDPCAIDDGSCDYGDDTCPDPCNVILGCTDMAACNFDAAANCNDGSCVANFDACTDPTACNYNSDACATDDGSCFYDCTTECDLQYSLDVICNANVGAYQVLIVLAVSPGEDDFVIVDNNTNETYSLSSQIFTSPVIETGTGYSYTLYISSDPECQETVGESAIDCTTTAVELIDFAGEQKEAFNLLSWIVASEIDNSAFVVERSFDGSVFNDIGEVDSRGDSNASTAYSFNDYSVKPGIAYYRLSSVDNYGKRELVSNVITLNRAIQEIGFSVYPIPAENFLNLTLENITNGLFDMTIYDINGKVVQRSSLEINGSAKVDVSSLANGSYFISLTNKSFVLQQPFLKN